MTRHGQLQVPAGRPDEFRGQVMLFMHDWFTDPEESWREQIPFFSRDFTCKTFTLLGHKDYAAYLLKQDSVVEANVQRLVDFIKLCKEPVRIVAHGISGIIALEASLLIPESIKSIALINTRFSYQNDRWFRLAGKLPLLFVPLTIYLRDPLGAHVSFRGRIRNRLGLLGSNWAGLYMKDLSIIDIIPDIPLIQPPVVIIAGEKDPLLDMEESSRVNDLLSESHLIHYSELGHSPHEEAPTLINQSLLEFFKKRSGLINQIRGFLKKFIWKKS